MKNPLVAGDLAPAFSAQDTFGNVIQLSDYEDKHVLLVFMRYSACPFCNLSVHRLSLEYPTLRQNGCEVIAFIQSTAENIKHNIYDKHKVRPEYPIIPDVSQTYYKIYGVSARRMAAVKSINVIPHWFKSISDHGFKRPEVSGDLLLVPATFLIGPHEQAIIKAEYNSSFYEHGTFTEIYEPLVFS